MYAIVHTDPTEDGLTLFFLKDATHLVQEGNTLTATYSTGKVAMSASVRKAEFFRDEDYASALNRYMEVYRQVGVEPATTVSSEE